MNAGLRAAGSVFAAATLAFAPMRPAAHPLLARGRWLPSTATMPTGTTLYGWEADAWIASGRDPTWGVRSKGRTGARARMLQMERARQICRRRV